MTTVWMRAMLKRLNVDTLEFAYAELGAPYALASKRCRSCANTEACATWLDEGCGVDDPTFCPNLEVFKHFGAECQSLGRP